MTHDDAMRAWGKLGGPVSPYSALARYIAQQRAQQEQSEREASALRAEAAELQHKNEVEQSARKELQRLLGKAQAEVAELKAERDWLLRRWGQDSEPQQSPTSAEPSLWSSERYAAASPGRDRPVMVGHLLQALRGMPRLIAESPSMSGAAERVSWFASALADELESKAGK